MRKSICLPTHQNKTYRILSELFEAHVQVIPRDFGSIMIFPALSPGPGFRGKYARAKQTAQGGTCKILSASKNFPSFNIIEGGPNVIMKPCSWILHLNT